MVIGTHDLERLGKVALPPRSMQESSGRVPKEERCPGVCTAGTHYKTYPQIANPRKD